MCGGLFGRGGGGATQQMLALQAIQQQQMADQQAAAAQQARTSAAASIAQANLDTESSRVAAENRLRRANMAQGFTASILGGGQMGAPGVGVKSLFGQ
jgi:hypothetical protein